jgi:hypothetical protein
MSEEKNKQPERGPSEYAKKEEGQAKPRPKTRFVFNLAAFVLLLLVVYIAWFFIRTGKKPSQVAELLDEKSRAELVEQMAFDWRAAAHAGKEASVWAEKEFKDWDRALSQRLKSPPPKTKEESSALVKETKEHLEAPPAGTGQPAGVTGKKAEPARSTVNPAMTKAINEYADGMKAYTMTDPAAPQAQVQQYLRLAAGHFEVCLYWIDQARAQHVAASVIDRYEQPATKRLYDCRKRMELTR